jgi:hypothetical protein
MRLKPHVSENALAGPMDDKQATLGANQKADKEAHHEVHQTANYMAHQGDGTHSPQGSEALSATNGKPRPCPGTAQRWPRDNNEVQRANRKANNAANHEADRKANYKADRSGKAKTPDDVQEAEGAQGEFGLDNKLDEAEKA